jgi:hypothetical protein
MVQVNNLIITERLSASRRAIFLLSEGSVAIFVTKFIEELHKAGCKKFY